jgi:hypothetical protein
MENLGIKYIQEKNWSKAYDVSLKNKSWTKTRICLLCYGQTTFCLVNWILITPSIENNVHIEQLFLFCDNIGCAVCVCACAEMDSSGMFISCLLKYTCIMYTSFKILHVSLVLIFIYYCQVFVMVVDLVMVFFYVFVVCSGYMFQRLRGTTYSLHFQGDWSSSSGCRSYTEKEMCCLCRTVWGCLG